MKLIKTGKFATLDQCNAVKNAYDVAYRLPIMADLPGGKLVTPPEDFRDMANRFAKEAGLPEGKYGIDPETHEFVTMEVEG